MTQAADTVHLRARASRRSDVYPAPAASTAAVRTAVPAHLVGSTFPASAPSTTAAIPAFTQGHCLNQFHFLHTC
jgi:hypothetical protein